MKLSIHRSAYSFKNQSKMLTIEKEGRQDMKRVNNFSYITVILICVFFLSVAGTAISQAGPPGPPGSAGPKGPGPMGPPIPIVAVDEIKDKACLTRVTNTFKNCVNKCPELDLESPAPNIEGAECILKCIENYANAVNGCM